MAEIKTDSSELITPAWRVTALAGILLGSDAGFMIAAKGKVYFLWKNPRMRHNWDILFAADKQDVKAEWPRHYFGAGVRLTIDSKVYIIHFIQPNGAKPITEFDWNDVASGDILPPVIRALALPLAAYDLYRDAKEARRNARTWREYLEK